MSGIRADLFAVGDRVRLQSTGECGIVVSSWTADELSGITDCYVAFFGRSFPSRDQRPTQVPYVLRYAATSLSKA